MVREVCEYCRDNGLTLTMDEVMDRSSWGPRPVYADSLSQIAAVLKEYGDVVRGTLMMCEYGGVYFNWPFSSVAEGDAGMPDIETYAQGESFLRERLAYQMAYADSLGFPRPFVSIEPAPLCCSHLLRSGIDRVDVEMIFGEESELRYAAAAGAVKAFGKDCFGVDNAMVWYGGEQHDELWFKRFRTSLYHSYIRGANPIYSEHGIMDYDAYDHEFDENHPDVVRYRQVLGEFASWVSRHPRAVGLPRAAVAFLQGRHDGFAGGWQTHNWGQRLREDWRITDEDHAWTLFQSSFQRRLWESRDGNGDVDYSGNPPLGMVEVLPYDAPDSLFSSYKVIILAGRNVMDADLYSCLVNYVRGGGCLLICASHLNEADSPEQGFTPFNAGDWSELTGLRVKGSQVGRMRFGLKFITNPKCGMKVHQYGKICDPWFTDGGFHIPSFEFCGAVPIAVGSDRFYDTEFNLSEVLLYENRIGEGSVIFCPSLDSPGSSCVRPFYEYLIARAMESVDVWPKVECSSRVRWAVYPDGTIYLLNTEERLSCEVRVQFSAKSSVHKIRLKPGEIKTICR